MFHMKHLLHCTMLCCAAISIYTYRLKYNALARARSRFVHALFVLVLFMVCSAPPDPPLTKMEGVGKGILPSLILKTFQT